MDVYGKVQDGTRTERETWVETGGFIGDVIGTIVNFVPITRAAATAVKVGGIVRNTTASQLISYGGEELAGYIYDNYIANGDSTNYDFLETAAPLILDLDGNGVEIADVTDSSTFIDLDGDGFLENTGWLGWDASTNTVDDGILVIDLAADGTAGPDGQVTSADEFVFTRHAMGATTDLEGLSAAFDNNQDGVLDALDS